MRGFATTNFTIESLSSRATTSDRSNRKMWTLRGYEANGSTVPSINKILDKVNLIIYFHNEFISDQALLIATDTLKIAAS